MPATILSQTRTATIEAARDEKAARLKDESVSGLEKALLDIKQRRLMERLTFGYNGLRAKFGAMATGSGFALGPEFFREDLAGGRLRVDASASISTRAWQNYRAGFGLPRLARGRVLVQGSATHRDYRSLEFYGNGPDSSLGGRSTYRLKDTLVQGTFAGEPVKHFRAGGLVGGLWTSVGPGRRPELANATSIFTEASAPGIARQSDFLVYGGFGQIDYRDDPFGPKSGGNYVIQYTRHDDRTLNAFEFGRWDLDVQQYIPVFNKTRRFALRGHLTLTDTKPGQLVPFYLQPYLGGSDDLRGFRPYRFTDRNAVVYNAEYRWEVFSGLDGALFFDAGKVMPRRGQLSFADLEASAGFGLRFNARNRTFIRLDVGFSHEGVGLWIKFNDAFLPRLLGTGTNQPLY